MTSFIKNTALLFRAACGSKSAKNQVNKNVVAGAVYLTRTNAGSFLEGVKAFVDAKASKSGRSLMKRARQFSDRFHMDTERSRSTGRVTKRTLTYNHKPIRSLIAKPLNKLARAAGQVVGGTLDNVATASPMKRKSPKPLTPAQSVWFMRELTSRPASQRAATKPQPQPQPQGTGVDRWTARTGTFKSTDGRAAINGNSGEIHPEFLQLANHRFSSLATEPASLPAATDAQSQVTGPDAWTSQTYKVKSTDGQPLINGNTGEFHPEMLEFLNRR